MEGKTKVTREVLCEESRFILANVLAEARYGRQNRYDDIRRVCEGAVSIPFSEYVTFLEAAGYLRQYRDTETLEVTEAGEEIVNGGSLAELTQAAVSHFKNARASRRRKEGSSPATLPEPAAASPPPGGPTPSPLPPRSGAPAAESRHAVYTAGGTRESPRRVGAEHSGEPIDRYYEKLATIGSGGIGTVYRARQVSLNRLVALKEIRELFGFFPEEQHGEIVRRFTDVVHQGACLAHPNILPIHEANLDRDYPYVVSELAPYGSARRLITDAETIPVELILKYLLNSLQALRAAHRERIFHRGLKPENILIDAFGNVKLSDFGFARIVERDASVIRQVYVGMGAVAYMAPELFADPTSAGPQADIYAIGIIFYELLTRRLPGRRSPMPSEIDAKLPKGIDDIFDAMTRDSLSDRYAMVDDILDDFDKIGGLGDVMSNQTQLLVASNPLKDVVFRPGSEMAQQLAAGGGNGRPGHGEVASGMIQGDGGDDVLSSAALSPPASSPAPTTTGEDDDDRPKRRPYSFQRRQRKP